MSNPDDSGGELPDTFDGRLAGIARLIDTMGAETDPKRRAQRRAAIVRLLTAAASDALDRIAVLLDRAAES